MAESSPDLSKYTCPVCMDVYTDPVSIPCGSNHIFCRSCLEPVLREAAPSCSLCRGTFDAKKIKQKTSLRKEIKSTKVECFGCKRQIQLADYASHQASCDKIDHKINYFKPIKETTQRIPQNLPNRSTFQCPYCDEKNLESKGLVVHCNEQHRHEAKTVVCPICSSMPWGNKNQPSTDFIQHLNMRHKFEYDTYVDYQQDDEAMLQAALKASLEG